MNRRRQFLETAGLRLFKWSLMSGLIVWTAVYKLSELGIKVPDFVYANF